MAGIWKPRRRYGFEPHSRQIMELFKAFLLNTNKQKKRYGLMKCWLVAFCAVNATVEGPFGDIFGLAPVKAREVNSRMGFCINFSCVKWKKYTVQ